MNKKRRKQIATHIDKLKECRNALEEIKDEEDETRDNYPDSFQDSQAYNASSDSSDALDSAIASIEDAVEELSGIT